MEFEALQGRALEVRQRYAECETRRYGRPWSAEELTLGFVSDVGDLSRLVLAQCEVREVPDAPEKLAHELADCLWSVLVLAHTFGIDLEAAFLQTMESIEAHLADEMAPALHPAPG